MQCEEHVRLLENYHARARAYTSAVEDLKKCAGLQMVNYEMAFKLCHAAQRLSQEAQRLLQRHIAEHSCR